MPHDAQQYHSQQFEHIIATIFTCRSVVKYNLTLNSEQRKELIGDIDSSLEALRSHLMTPPSDTSEDIPVRAQLAQPAPPPVFETDALSSEEASQGLPSEKQTLQSLYKIYHAYLDEKQSPNIYSFMKRFNEVMSIINEIQQNTQYVKQAGQDPVEQSLQRLQAFVSDLYYMFIDFIRVLSDLLQQNDVYLSTEELSSLSTPSYPLAKQNMQDEQKKPESGLIVLLQAYNTHQQLDQLKGDLTSRVREVTTFLNFLKQNVTNTASGREELIVRLNYATSLLDDMSRLLAEYAKAASTLL